MNNPIAFSRVSKSFPNASGGIKALQGLSFSVEEAEVFGFIGPNGAGKSTTIKIMLDVISDYEGEVRIFGVDARKAEARRGVAYVPESPALYEQFTPMEILRMGLTMYGQKHDDANAWCMKWLEKFSIAHTAKRRIRELSKGTVQRVALAHAMAVSPRFLVLDEPLSGLDPVGRKDVVDILSDYKHQGGAIFFTSHVLHDVERIADRFGFINKGEIVTTRSPQSLVGESEGRLLVRFQCSPEAGLGGTLLREGEYEVAIEQKDLPDWLARLNSLNGRLMTVKPEMSLERVFFQILEKGARKDDAPASEPA